MERLTYRDEYGFAYIRGTDAINLEERNDEAIEKLAAYEDAEEEGRLIISPCKMGDKIYWIQRDCISNAFECPDPELDCIYCEDSENHIKTVSFDLFWLKEDGKGELKENVFKSREEAEARLKEMETEKLSGLAHDGLVNVRDQVEEIKNQIKDDAEKATLK